MEIGILTHYYLSENYGGNLQAYALCKVLNRMGHHAQQLSLDRTRSNSIPIRIKIALKKAVRSCQRPRFSANMNRRRKAIRWFNQGMIPHSKPYSEKNISTCADQYDGFVTGSDQVWHPQACCDAYLLKFVPDSKIKISYAASVATDVLPPECRERYRKAFADFWAISVREQDTVALLQDISPVKVERTLDPTLLLPKEEWEKIAVPYTPKEKYVFCYFLGDDEQQRAVAAEFAQKHGLKVVTMPHLLGEYRKCDANFGDEQLYDVSPGMLLSLIREAEYVYTDSFHASVFSLIFEKQFFIFQRSGAKGMGVRIQSLTELFDVQDRFCYESHMLDAQYLTALPAIDYVRHFDKFEEAKKASMQFLKTYLGTPSERITNG